MIDNKWLKMKEAAEAIGCSSGHVRQLLRTGELVGLKVTERAWIVDKKSIEKFNKKPKKTGRPRGSKENSRKSA